MKKKIPISTIQYNTITFIITEIIKLFIVAILSWIVKSKCLGSKNLLDQNSLLLLRHVPNKATDENVNIERVRKYFTKQGWKALKALLIEKKMTI